MLGTDRNSELTTEHTIIYIEHDEMIAAMYKLKFELNGISILHYISIDDDVIDMIEKVKPIAVVTRILSPEKNNIDYLRSLKLNPETNHIPLIGLDNLAEKYVDDYKEVGIEYYLVMADYVPREIITNITEYLNITIK